MVILTTCKSWDDSPRVSMKWFLLVETKKCGQNGGERCLLWNMSQTKNNNGRTFLFFLWNIFLCQAVGNWRNQQKTKMLYKLFWNFLVWCVWQGKIHWFWPVGKKGMFSNGGFLRTRYQQVCHTWGVQPLGILPQRSPNKKLTWNPTGKKRHN